MAPCWTRCGRAASAAVYLTNFRGGPLGGFFKSLETQFQGKLHLPRIARRSEESELRCSPGGGVDRVLRARLRKLQIRMVEHVEEFCPKLDLRALLNGKRLEQGEVPNLVAGTRDRIASHVPKGAVIRICERAIVHPRDLGARAIGGQPSLREGGLAARIRISRH